MSKTADEILVYFFDADDAAVWALTVIAVSISVGWLGAMNLLQNGYNYNVIII